MVTNNVFSYRTQTSILDQKFRKSDFTTANFHTAAKFGSKIEILVKNRNFGQKSKFWSKIEIFMKNENFGQKSYRTKTSYRTSISDQKF